MASIKTTSIVKINATTVPEGAGEELERRFSANSSKMADVLGSINFQLLCPTVGESHYFVFTEWEGKEVCQGQCEDCAFKASHGDEKCKPMSSSAELLEFDVMLGVKT